MCYMTLLLVTFLPLHSVFNSSLRIKLCTAKKMLYNIPVKGNKGKEML